MGLDLLHPWALVALAPVPALWWVLRRTLTDFGRAQRALMGTLRTLILVLLVLALAAPMLSRRTSRTSLTLLVDVSPSMSDTALKRADTLAQTILERAHVPVRLIAFDRDARAVPATGFTAFQRAHAEPPSTDVAGALRFARAGLPEGYVGRIAILTDGQDTSIGGQTTPVTGGRTFLSDKGRREGLPHRDGGKAPPQTNLAVLVPPEDDRPEVMAASLEVAGKLTPGATVELRAHVLSTRETSATMTVFVDGFRVGEARPVKLHVGENVLSAPARLGRSGSETWSVRIASADDTHAGNNAASRVVTLPAGLKVLLVEQSENDARFLARVLRDGGLDVDVRTAAGFPTTLVDLDRYACVVLSDVPASMMSESQMRMVKTWVEDLGGGLVMVGGEDSFGLGGWFGTPVEEVLPVRLDVRKKKEQPTLAMMILLDKSGSMQQGKKMSLAKDDAAAAVEVLGPDDVIGVVTFDAQASLVMPPRKATDRTLIRTMLAGVQAGGGTNIYPALEIADRELVRLDARLKHVILLTDGQTSPGNYRGLVGRMANDGITVSTVAVGSEVDEKLLQEIARWGRGRFYHTQDAMSIPQIFVRETMTASRSAVVEEPFRPRVVRDADVIRGLNFDTAPYLLGYVATRVKPMGEVILATERAEPLLVRGRAGLGKTAAFTSDAKNRWSAEWMSWPGFGKLWTQIIRDVMRERPAGSADVKLSFAGDVGTVDVLAADADGRFRDRLDARATVTDPDGSVRRIRLEQVAPGRYRGRFNAPTRGAYVAAATFSTPGPAKDTAGQASSSAGSSVGQTFLSARSQVVVSAAVKSPASEFSRLGVDRDALKRLASGGRLIEANDWARDPDKAANALLAPGSATVRITRRLSPILLWASLALFFLDLLLRRFDLRNLRTRWTGKAAALVLLAGTLLITGRTCGADSNAAAGGTTPPDSVKVPAGLPDDPEAIVRAETHSRDVERLARLLLIRKEDAAARKLLDAERERIVTGTSPQALSVPDAVLLYLRGIVVGAPDAAAAEVARLAPPTQGFHLDLANEMSRLHREREMTTEISLALELAPADSGEAYNALSLRVASDVTNRRWKQAADGCRRQLEILDHATWRSTADAQLREGLRAERDTALGFVALEKKTPESLASASKLAESAWRSAPFNIETLWLGKRVAEALDDAKLKAAWRKRADDALTYYRAQARTSPHDATAHNSLAWFCAVLNRDLDEGIAHARTAVRLAPAEGACIDTLAECLFQAGHADEAAATMKRVIDLYPFADDYYRRQLDRFHKADAPAGGAP